MELALGPNEVNELQEQKVKAEEAAWHVKFVRQVNEFILYHYKGSGELEFSVEEQDSPLYSDAAPDWVLSTGRNRREFLVDCGNYNPSVKRFLKLFKEHFGDKWEVEETVPKYMWWQVWKFEDEFRLVSKNNE